MNGFIKNYNSLYYLILPFINAPMVLFKKRTDFEKWFGNLEDGESSGVNRREDPRMTHISKFHDKVVSVDLDHSEVE